VTDAKISKETRIEALKIARATQKPGQRKEQTKLIARGIEKGVAEYRKREKIKARERDRLKKKEQKSEQQQPESAAEVRQEKSTAGFAWLPWLLLAASWVFFVIYLRFQRLPL
jgi:hypothetical protein